MINPTIITNIGGTTVWEILVQNGPTINTGVDVTITIPSEFNILSVTPTIGSFSGNIWTIDSLDPNQCEKLILVLELTTLPPNGTTEFCFDAVVTGLDTIPTNNTLTDCVSFNYIPTEPMGGANPDCTSCLCIDVSQNDTPCSEGVSEWRIRTNTIVNGILIDWDETTGQGNFTYIDPTKPITFEYDLFCILNGSEYEVACNVSAKINPNFESVNIFNHTISQVTCLDLTSDEIAILTASNPLITDICDYTWHVIRNGEGVLTSGVPLPKLKNLVGYLCSEGQIVFVWNNDGQIEYVLPDGATFLGDPLTLSDCCCKSEDGNGDEIESCLNCDYFTE